MRTRLPLWQPLCSPSEQDGIRRICNARFMHIRTAWDGKVRASRLQQRIPKIGFLHLELQLHSWDTSCIPRPPQAATHTPPPLKHFGPRRLLLQRRLFDLRSCDHLLKCREDRLAAASPAQQALQLAREPIPSSGAWTCHRLAVLDLSKWVTDP